MPPRNPVKFLFLSALPEGQERALMDSLPRVVYEDGGVIFERGDETTDIYFILEGATKSATYGPEGNLAYFKMRKEGDFFGYYSAVTGKPRTANMIAVGHTVLAKMSGKAFMELVLSHRALSEYMLKMVTELLRSETDRITNLITMDARGRLAAEIVSLCAAAKGDGRIVEIPPRNEFAARLGMTRETLARNLSLFVQDGILELQQNHLHILDIERLSDFYLWRFNV